MKGRPFYILVIACAIFTFKASVTHAFIASINSPLSSNASVIFDDTNSLNALSFPGTTNTGPAVSPWNGSLQNLTLTTDSVTGDFAKGGIFGSFTPFTNNYAINIGGVKLHQTATDTGYATLTYTFNIEYQLDGAGMSPQPTLFPNFAVNGTVQPSSGSFASVTGFIDYYGTIQTTAGLVPAVYETVNYNNVWSTPGPFTGIAFGVPVNGTTPAFIPGTTLTLNGAITFKVDPSTIDAETIAAPEPSTFVLGGLGLIALLAVARRKKPALVAA